MKKIASLLLILACLVGSLCSCERIEEMVKDIVDENIPYTEGLDCYIIEDNECIVSVGSAGELEEIRIPRKIDGNRVVAIDERGFAFLESLKKVTVPDGVYRIGGEAFMYCFALESVNLPESVTYIGASAFNGCRSLCEINLPDGLTRIEERTFYYCEGLSNIKLPETVTYIGKNAFTRCAFTELTVPDHITYIGEYAFSGCKSLTTVYIPEGTRVMRCVFNGCDSLETVVYGGTRDQWYEMMEANEMGGGYEDTCYKGVKIVFEK